MRKENKLKKAAKIVKDAILKNNDEAKQRKGKLKKLSSLIPLHMLEDSAQQQIYDALDLDFLIKLAVMPDCHTGYLLPIGGVALLDNVISPMYVGYDKGCGMCYIDTGIPYRDIIKNYKKGLKIFNKIYELIPVGFNRRSKSIDYPEFKSAIGDKELDKKIETRIHSQMGTLGGGNHFIELGETRQATLGVTIHSGSRKAGWWSAEHYINISNVNDTELPKGFLHLNGALGQSYVQDLKYFLQYALDNRKMIMNEVLQILGFSEFDINKMFKTMINENHNHAEVLSNNQVIHRKGATPADKDQLGVIPGNMLTGVYITKGLGNKEYLSSASHGAGRKMSRTKAKKSIDLERFKDQMKDVIAKVGKSTLDEAPDAYKNLTEVVKCQEGIVIDVVDYITPKINIKG